MKPASLFAAALVTLATFHLMAQQAEDAAPQTTAANTAGSHAKQSGTEEAAVARNPADAAPVAGASNASFRAPRRLRLVNAELVGKLDSKSVKVGEAVVLKTQEPITTGDGTAMPKGTRLVGHVIAVQAHGKGVEDSAVAVQFDRAEMKSGQTLPIFLAIRSVMPPATAGMIDAMQSGKNLGGGVMGDGVRTLSGSGALHTGDGAAGANGGGTINTNGLIVGDGRGAVRGGTAVDDTVAAPVNGQMPAGGILAVGATAQDRPHATGVRGVMLADDASGKLSGTFSAAKQNVHLDGGTQMVLAVAAVR